MGRSITIKPKGVVRRPYSYSRFWVELFNENGKLSGREVLVTVSERITREGVEVKTDDIVVVELCTSYNNKGRILEMVY